MKKRYDSLDCLKGIACLAVVFIHFNFTGGTIPAFIGTAIKAACRFAVPIFFTISGFFLTKSKDIDVANVFRKLRHVLKMVFFSGLFYLVFAQIWYRLYEGASWDWMSFTLKQFTGDKVLKMFLTHDPLVYSHLWFLLSLICCYVFALLFIQKKTFKLVYVLAPVLLCAFSCMQEFRLLTTSILLPGMESRIYLYNSFLFRALPFFLFGMILQDQLARIQRKPLSVFLFLGLAVLGVCMEIVERKYIGESQFFVGSYLVAFSLIIGALQYPDMKIGVLQHIGRDLSMWVYILHIAVGKVLDLVAKYCHLWGKDAYYISRPLIIIAASLLIAEALYRIGILINRKKRERMPAL